MIKKLIPIFLASFLAAGCHSASNSSESLLRELDRTLSMESTYQAYFLQRTAVLSDLLQGAKTPEQEYEIHARLAEEFGPYSLDSTLAHLNRNRAIARAASDPIRLAETDFALVMEYGLAGYHSDAFDILQQYPEERVPEVLKTRFFDAANYLYGEMAAYSSNPSSYWQLRDQYRDSLLTRMAEGSYEWLDQKRIQAEADRNNALALSYAMQALEVTTPNSRRYARAAFFVSTYYKSDRQEQIRWLARSAIADAMCATKDYASLNDLAEILYEEGDTKRAFQYVADHCMKDALFFNGKLRPWQITQFFPALEQAYEAQSARGKRSMAVMMMISMLLLVALAALLYFLARRQRILENTRQDLLREKDRVERRNASLSSVNSQLSDVNAALQEANKVRQEYIGLFLQSISENISTSRKYKNHVLTYIRRGNDKYLVEEIMALPPLEEDISQFNRMFDETFINLYPDFVEKFNALLQDGEEIQPKGEDILTPELRVFALIKLGVVESSRIASLLHYSANTVYNYRAKIKNKARGDREQFESAVQAIE